MTHWVWSAGHYWLEHYRLVARYPWQPLYYLDTFVQSQRPKNLCMHRDDESNHCRLSDFVHFTTFLSHRLCLFNQSLHCTIAGDYHTCTCCTIKNHFGWLLHLYLDIPTENLFQDIVLLIWNISVFLALWYAVLYSLKYFTCRNCLLCTTGDTNFVYIFVLAFFFPNSRSLSLGRSVSLTGYILAHHYDQKLQIQVDLSQMQCAPLMLLMQ